MQRETSVRLIKTSRKSPWGLDGQVQPKALYTQPTIYWYEAPEKNGDPWKQHVLSNTFSGTDIYTGDINRDSKTDLVVSGAFIDKLAWYEYKSEDGKILWTEHIIDDCINDPGDVSKLSFLSKKTYSKMVQNLWWAAGYNILAIPLAAGVLYSYGVVINPAIGALLMSLSTVIVAINSQTLRKYLV